MKLKERTELSEATSLALRERLLAKHPRPGVHMAQVIFDGYAEIEISVRVPTCQVTPIDGEAIQAILGSHSDGINDRLQDLDYLCGHLSDAQISELTTLLGVATLRDCTQYTLFLDQGSACLTRHLSKTTKKLTFPHLKLPYQDSDRFCWLQILPLVQTQPRKYIPALSQACFITEVRLFTSDYTLIEEMPVSQQPYVIDMLKKPPHDPISYLYGNRTEFDIQCLLSQCRTFLGKLESQEYHGSYRLRYIRFLVYQGGLTYMAKKLVQLAHGPNKYMWYL